MQVCSFNKEIVQNEADFHIFMVTYVDETASRNNFNSVSVGGLYCYVSGIPVFRFVLVVLVG